MTGYNFMSKLYSILLLSETEKKAARGISGPCRDKVLNHSVFKQVLKDGSQMRNLMCSFRTDKHDISTVVVNKISLSAFDDKRWIYDEEGVKSFAYGHFRIRQMKEEAQTSSKSEEG